MKKNTSKYSKLMTEAIKNVDISSSFHLSGPTKISLKDRSSFSVPAGPEFACIGATDACKECYATKKRHQWPSVQKVMARNWKLLKKFKRYNQTDKAVEAILYNMRKDSTLMRIYESGDFESEWTINMWSEVVRIKKDINFWAYTRSFSLDFTPLTRWPNFSLWASTDPHNMEEAKQFVRRFRKSGTKHAYGPWKHDAEIPENSLVCPVTSGQMEMKGACERCSLCVVKKRIKKNVVFLEH